MIYLRTILTRNNQELLKRAYRAQQYSPTEGDYAILVKEDFRKLCATITEAAITGLTNDQYKQFIKKKIKAATFNQLKIYPKKRIQK